MQARSAFETSVSPQSSVGSSVINSPHCDLTPLMRGSEVRLGRARWWPFCAAIVIVAAGGGCERSGPDLPEIRELVAAIGPRRPADVRVTGGFAYGPVDAEMRAAVSRNQRPEVTIAVAKIERRAARDASAATLDALGLALLMTRDFASAVRVLEAAVAQYPDDGRLLADLS